MKHLSNSYFPKSDKTLTAIVGQIIKTADPDKIILFGSRANGKYKKDSDYDMCVLKKNLKKRRELARKIYSNMNINASVDIIVTTPSRFNQLKDKWFFVYHDIFKYGQTVYEK